MTDKNDPPMQGRLPRNEQSTPQKILMWKHAV
eukprot:CAMPEP_0115538364 /NCGR_PEP_ID=MMETSP0271-20121206/88843_1 /TAXON_ID=71861 /ORGANISM="Scrippsiella trochoidea, Strain CCMP3099" /LENGTH=31 /DNA_ID= /DNA_START= /DNA_END= /DNA_ORIENTATION=